MKVLSLGSPILFLCSYRVNSQTGAIVIRRRCRRVHNAEAARTGGEAPSRVAREVHQTVRVDSVTRLLVAFPHSWPAGQTSGYQWSRISIRP